MSVSKKKRFDVFKRDGFTCQYCGRKPPEVVLQADHIDPVALGGGDEIENLLTACVDCNQGKKHFPLDQVPAPLADRAAELAERELQIKEYRKFLRSVKKRKQSEVDEVAAHFTKLFPGSCLTERFKEVSIKKFLETFAVEELNDNLTLAYRNIAKKRAPDPEATIKYFCGICWNKIKEGGR